MDEREIFEMRKNARIKIDHYSWPKRSMYRIFEKDDLNRRCMEKIEEYKKNPNPDNVTAIRTMAYMLCVDPPELPAHPSWDDKEFEREALGALFKIISTKKDIRRGEALRLARSRARTKDIRKKEIFERIIFEFREAREDEFEELVAEVHGGER